jgi:hypothetical protein
MSNPDFPSATARHLRDAEYLLASSPANARYLAGYVAERALKAVIERSDPMLHAPAFVGLAHEVYEACVVAMLLDGVLAEVPT